MVPRPWCLAALNLGMGIAHGLLCLPGSAGFYSGVSLAGLAFGAQYPVLITTVAELFGTARVASNYMLYDGTPQAMASIAIAKYFVQYVYQAHTAMGNKKCIGDSCFRFSHVALVGLQAVAGFAIVCLARRSRHVYQVSVWGPSKHQKGLV